MKRARVMIASLAFALISCGGGNGESSVVGGEVNTNLDNGGAVGSQEPANIDGTTVASGVIDGDQVWRIEGSPYRVDGLIEIAPATTLTISPGVQVFGDAIFEVHGTLIAVGTASQKIQFDNLAITSSKIVFAPPSEPGAVNLNFIDVKGILSLNSFDSAQAESNASTGAAASGAANLSVSSGIGVTQILPAGVQGTLVSISDGALHSPSVVTLAVHAP